MKLFSFENSFRNKFIMSTTSRLAQLVEHETLNLRVVGSSPTLGDQFILEFSHPVNRETYIILVTFNAFLNTFIPSFCHINRFYSENFRKKWSPNVGLEPTTLRLRVSCSTNWASRDMVIFVNLFLNKFFKATGSSMVKCDTLKPYYNRFWWCSGCPVAITFKPSQPVFMKCFWCALYCTRCKWFLKSVQILIKITSS